MSHIIELSELKQTTSTIKLAIGLLSFIETSKWKKHIKEAFF